MQKRRRPKPTPLFEFVGKGRVSETGREGGIPRPKANLSVEFPTEEIDRQLSGRRHGVHSSALAGPKEAGAGEGGDVDREVLLGDDAGIARDGGRLVRSAEPAVVAADLGR